MSASHSPSLKPALGQSSPPRMILAEESCPTCDQPIPHDHYEEIKERIEQRQREKSAEIAARLQEQHARDKAQALEQVRAESEARIAAARGEERAAAEVSAGERVAAAERAGTVALGALQARLSEAEAARSTAEATIRTVKEEAAEREAKACAEAVATAEAKVAKKLADIERDSQEAERALRQKIETVEAGKAEAETKAAALHGKLAEQQQQHVAVVEKLQADAAARETEIRRHADTDAQAAVQDKMSVLAGEKQAAEARAALGAQQVQALQQAHESQLQQVREAMEKAKDDAVNAEKSAAFEERLKLQSKFEELKRAYDKKTAEELGEGAEIDLYEALKQEFPNDRLERIHKGQPGADILHTVVHNGRESGRIIYDSKNHNAWRNDFVTKLSSDQMAAKAEHAVLSTSKFPAGGRQLQVQDGVVLANPARVVTVVQIVRQHLIQTHTLRLSSEERAQKTAALYDFITSERCFGFFGRIDTHTDDLLELQVKEKKAHDATWKRQGELIRSVQKVRAELSNEIEAIVGAAAEPEGAR